MAGSCHSLLIFSVCTAVPLPLSPCCRCCTGALGHTQTQHAGSVPVAPCLFGASCNSPVWGATAVGSGSGPRSRRTDDAPLTRLRHRPSLLVDLAVARSHDRRRRSILREMGRSGFPACRPRPVRDRDVPKVYRWSSPPWQERSLAPGTAITCRSGGAITICLKRLDPGPSHASCD